MPPPRRILLIKPSSLGDVVHALPVLAALRAAYPEAHIAWLVSTSFVPLLDGHPLLNEVISFDRRLYGRMLRSPRATNAFIRFTSALRRREFDLVLDLQGLFRSGFLARATGAPRRIGFAAAREMAWMFYTERVTCPDADEHAVLKNMRLVAAVVAPASAGPSPPPSSEGGAGGGCAHAPLGRVEFPLGLRADELAAARERLDVAANRPIDGFTAVLPGARWPSKLPAGPR
jgi:ADP-heptose:LPS heptosyltransferase